MPEPNPNPRRNTTIFICILIYPAISDPFPFLPGFCHLMGQAWLIVEPYCTLVFVLVIPFFPKSVASGSQEWIEPRGGEDLQ